MLYGDEFPSDAIPLAKLRNFCAATVNHPFFGDGFAQPCQRDAQSHLLRQVLRRNVGKG